MATTAELERMLEENDFPGVVIEESDGRLVVSGIVMTEDERRSVLELLQDATEEPLEDDLEVDGTMPAVIRELADPGRVDRLSDVEVSEAEMRGFHGATEGLEEDTLEPGDFQSPDHVETDGWTAVGPTSALDEDLVAEGDTVFVPPSDPVVRRDPVTFRERVVGGLQESSMDDLHVHRSALDGQYGDEAIADAVRRELRGRCRDRRPGGHSRECARWRRAAAGARPVPDGRRQCRGSRRARTGRQGSDRGTDRGGGRAVVASPRPQIGAEP